MGFVRLDIAVDWRGQTWPAGSVVSDVKYPELIAAYEKAKAKELKRQSDKMVRTEVTK